VNVPAHDPPTPARSHLVVQSAHPLFTRPGRVLVGPRDSGVHRHVPADPPGRISQVCNAVTIWRHMPSRCHRRNSAYTADQDPYSTGTSRQGAPTRTRQRIPSINCRLVHNDGRPGRFAVGNNGSNTAHCASVRSNHPVTAMVSTRSPVVSGSSWSMNRYRRTRSSSITDTPQPASPSCPLEPCGVRTYFPDDLAASDLPCGRVVDAVGDASTRSVTVKLAGSQGSVSL
jgi:hypothetical protein